MGNLVGVKYIGNKAVKKDNVAFTGLIWVKDQIHAVPAALVPKFQPHGDVWEIVPITAADLPNVGLIIDELDPKIEALSTPLTPEEIAANEAASNNRAALDQLESDARTVEESILTQEELPASFDPLSKADIAAFGKRNYGVEFDHRTMTREALIDAVRATHNGRVQNL